MSHDGGLHHNQLLCARSSSTPEQLLTDETACLALQAEVKLEQAKREGKSLYHDAEDKAHKTGVACLSLPGISQPSALTAKTVQCQPL